MKKDYLVNAIDLLEIERSIQKKYRKDTYARFMKAITEYELIEEGDRIAVGISGGKDSLLLAKMLQALQKYSQVNFTVEYLAMDPGYSKENRQKLEDICEYLDIPVKIYKSDVFEVTERIAKENPCYMCARMRRGFLYSKVEELGCNKLALGHHYNDVIETTLLNVLWAGNYKSMMPKLKSRNFEGLELIRPLYLVEEEDIIRWMNNTGIIALDCACPINKKKNDSQRKNIKKLIDQLKEDNPNIEHNIFRSAENVALDAILGYTIDGEKHSFLEEY